MVIRLLRFFPVSMVLVWAGLISTISVVGQERSTSPDRETLTRILFVFDASGSMGDHWQSDTKYRIAVQVLADILDSLNGHPSLQTGLRVYGPKRDGGDDCHASYLMVPPGKDNGSLMTSILNGMRPGGSTPIAYSLEQVADDFPPCADCRNIVILITDGMEACAGDPCAVSLRLQQEGIFLRPFIVGIGKDLRGSFDCMGWYADALREADYTGALKTIVATALKGATVQLSLLDDKGDPTQTDLHVTLFNGITGKPHKQFIHTLDINGLPDTLLLDPLVPWDIVVQTIPPVKKEQVWIKPGEHTMITLDVPQGFLSFGPQDHEIRHCIIRRSGTGEAIHVQFSNEREKYLAGTYDITVLTLPPMNYSGVIISPDAETRLPVPASGQARLIFPEPVTGEIFMQQGESLLWVCRLRGNSNQQILNLQPGNYIVFWKPLSAHSNDDTRELPFSIDPGQQTELRTGAKRSSAEPVESSSP